MVLYDTFITVSHSSLTDQMQLKALFFDWLKCQCLYDDKANLMRKSNFNNINHIPIYPNRK